MRGSSATQVPVVGHPLPSCVRAEIHNLIRDGFTFLDASEVNRSWYVEYQDGTRRIRRLVPHSAAAAA
jgi:hypothetical protein